MRYKKTKMKFSVFVGCFVYVYVLPVSLSAIETDLQEKNEDNLNPINDNEHGDHVSKEQEKRTIFSKHHGWAKHVGVHPSGFKYVIGYGPVDLKYVPVVKPVSIKAPHHFHQTVYNPLKWHGKPSVVLKPLLPVKPIVHHDGWKPIIPLVKPISPPAHIVTKPWHHPQPVVPVVKPLVPVKPVHVDVVPAKPIIPIAAPVAPVVKPIFPLPIWEIPSNPAGVPLHNPGLFPQYAPGAPIVDFHGHHNFVHQHVPVALPQPIPPPAHVHPAHIHPAEIHPGYVHPAQLHPAEIYPGHVHPNVAVPAQILPGHIHPINVVPQAEIHPASHVQPAHIHPGEVHPGYVQQGHVHPAEIHPGHIHPQQVQPIEAPLIPHGHSLLPNHLHIIPQHQPEVHHQDVHNIYQQELPLAEDGVHHHHQPQVPVSNGPYLYQQQLPGNVQHLFNQQIQHGEGATSNILLHGATIQPGHTDVQVPVHLPQHPNYLPHDPRPSITLEPPFTHK